MSRLGPSTQQSVSPSTSQVPASLRLRECLKEGADSKSPEVLCLHRPLPWRAWAPNSCGYLCKIKPGGIPAWREEHVQPHPWLKSTAGRWEFLGEEGSLFFGCVTHALVGGPTHSQYNTGGTPWTQWAGKKKRWKWEGNAVGVPERDQTGDLG